MQMTRDPPQDMCFCWCWNHFVKKIQETTIIALSTWWNTCSLATAQSQTLTQVRFTETKFQTPTKRSSNTLKYQQLGWNSSLPKHEFRETSRWTPMCSQHKTRGCQTIHLTTIHPLPFHSNLLAMALWTQRTLDPVTLCWKIVGPNSFLLIGAHAPTFTNRTIYNRHFHPRNFPSTSHMHTSDGKRERERERGNYCRWAYLLFTQLTSVEMVCILEVLEVTFLKLIWQRNQLHRPWITIVYSWLFEMNR